LISLIIGCDANAHHTKWGSTNTNTRSESLLNYLLSTNLVLCNKGCGPTFIIKDMKVVIDLTLVSLSLYDLIRDWKMADDHSFSDHRYTEFSLNQTKPIPFPI